MSNQKIFTIFYSWQSDLPDASNRAFIRQALRSAASEVERSESDLIIQIDEATRNVSGSPNIPATILSKIAVADAFICDITTINSDQKVRQVPNPNVVFELGYAVANVGWERSILLFNREFGTFPDDLPFDFDRHRISDFMGSSVPSSNQKQQLVKLLETALKAVIKGNPEKPNRTESAEQKKRNRDIENINWALSTIHIPTLDQHVSDCPKMMVDRVLYFWEGFNAVISNSLFHLYDETLLNLFKKYHAAFYDTVKYGECYHPNYDCSAYIFTNPGDMALSPEKDAIWSEIQNAAHEMYRLMPKILKLIRDNYLEVSIDEANDKAWRDYVRFKKDQAHELELDA